MNPEEKNRDEKKAVMPRAVTSTPTPAPAPTPNTAPATVPASAAVTETKTTVKGTNTKTGAKKEIKETKEKAVSGKPLKKKGKKEVWVKKEKMKKGEKTKDLAGVLKGKWKPNFWGRFGKKNLRTQRMDKFNKWRKPRGIDILFRKDDGSIPQAGYRTPKTIRGIHPSGYHEVLIFSKNGLNMVKQNQAVRFSSTIGRKKRIELIKIANEKKIPVLN